MTNEKLLQLTLKDLENNSLVCKNSNFIIISTINNLVVKINNAYLKIYTNRGSTQKDNELDLYKKIGNNNLFKSILHQGTVGDYEYALFKEVKGNTLEKEMYSLKHSDQVAKAVHDFINTTATIKTNPNKFGYINNSSFEGSHGSLSSFLNEFYSKVSKVLNGHAATKKYSDLPLDLISQNMHILDSKQSNIVPADLNSRNIVISPDGTVKIIDPGTLIASTPEMAYGNFKANNYGTPAYKEFEKLLTNVNQKSVQVYSTLHLLNILSFVVYYKTGSPKKAKPYGNKNNVVDMIDKNIKTLNLKT